jgi:hypothetical protein
VLFNDFAILATKNETMINKIISKKKGKSRKNHESLTHPVVHNLFKTHVQNNINRTFIK